MNDGIAAAICSARGQNPSPVQHDVKNYRDHTDEFQCADIQSDYTAFNWLVSALLLRFTFGRNVTSASVRGRQRPAVVASSTTPVDSCRCHRVRVDVPVLVSSLVRRASRAPPSHPAVQWLPRIRQLTFSFADAAFRCSCRLLTALLALRAKWLLDQSPDLLVTYDGR